MPSSNTKICGAILAFFWESFERERLYLSSYNSGAQNTALMVARGFLSSSSSQPAAAKLLVWREQEAFFASNLVAGKISFLQQQLCSKAKLFNIQTSGFRLRLQEWAHFTYV